MPNYELFDFKQFIVVFDILQLFLLFMKRIHILICCSVFSLLASAQDFIPLRIDSSYSFFRSVDFVGNPIEVISYAGYSYNAEDELLEIRRENERSTFTYSDDQEQEVIQIFLNGFWENSKRITTSFDNEYPTEILTELFTNANWENSKKISIDYNNDDQLLTQLTQVWDNNEWRNQELLENIYDAVGNRTRQSYSNSNEAGNFVFTFGDRINYNDNNQPIEILSLTGNSTGDIFFSDKFTIAYNEDDLQDTVIYCLYNFPDTINCQNLTRSIFSYDHIQNRIIRNIDSWNNSGWSSSGRTEEYAGRNIYSGLPDSIITYDYSLTTLDQIITRQYFKYFDLDENQVRFEESLFLYQLDIGQFALENYREEYYQKGELVNNTELTKEEEVVLFPNPIGKNQFLTIKNLNTESVNLAVYIYDVVGHLLQVETIGLTREFMAPDTPGMYFIQIKSPTSTTRPQKIMVR